MLFAGVSFKLRGSHSAIILLKYCFEKQNSKSRTTIFTTTALRYMFLFDNFFKIYSLLLHRSMTKHKKVFTVHYHDITPH